MERIISNSTIERRYKIQKRLAKGAFSVVYQGVDKKNGQPIAIKIVKGFSQGHSLNLEQDFYHSLRNGVGIPRILFYSGQKRYHILVMELLGPSLGDLLYYCSGKFSLKTTLLLAIQMINRIKFVHRNGIIHRDIKPENFVVGLNRNRHRIHLIDFGMAKRYRNPMTHEHIPLVHPKPLMGTPRYASINGHNSIEPSRRDDMESLCYVLLYFLRGNLPWQGLMALTNQQKYEKIAEIKMSFATQNFCKTIPKEFCLYLNYCRLLEFEQEPDYDYLIGMFEELFDRMQYVRDNEFDWVIANRDPNHREFKPENLEIDDSKSVAVTTDTEREAKQSTTENAYNVNKTHRHRHRSSHRQSEANQ